MKQPRARVVLMWHMHQPSYRTETERTYQLPWTYLHAIKDYVDMAALLEQEPGARAVVNFAPILVEQILDYAKQVDRYFVRHIRIKDPYLAALVDPVLPVQEDERALLIQQCLRANRERLIQRFPAYQRLADFAETALAQRRCLSYLNSQFVADLLVWYHLAWLGETVRRTDERIQRLMAKEHNYSLHDRRSLLAVIGELLSSVVPRYQALVGAGQVELSMNPYSHPILPLMLEFTSAREAMPDCNLPQAPAYPDGEARARWQLETGKAVFKQHFGVEPVGCWPSEGALSNATLALLAENGFRWTATGESVLRHSLSKEQPNSDACIHHRYEVDGHKLGCFFRDDQLSDSIGFRYATWHADDAVADLLHHLGNIASACKDQSDPVISIILDGENAWEYYPENGYYFLSALYRALVESEDFELTTFEQIEASGVQTRHINQLVAGSWVYGTFSTWIGDADKNRGWDLLVDAKKAYDQACAAGTVTAKNKARIERQLALCEGSDWFWWFGDYNPSESVSDFERLFRNQLTSLYELLDAEPPEQLTHRISIGRGAPEQGGTMRRGSDH
ncbi:MAG: glycoside hydrolase family 57 protein [Pseudomonadota bacterium]|nr:glycoside hydrolase family 57 protein [Pseudomonadota bacterium]